MAVPGNFVFSENIPHSTLIVIGVVVVIQRRGDISVIIAGRSRTRSIIIVTIPGSVRGVIERIGICVGPVWVAPARAPPGAPPPWRGEVADKDDLVEMLKAMKPIISIEVSVVETVKVSKAQG